MEGKDSPTGVPGKKERHQGHIFFSLQGKK
jgi:hypothetical protein